MTSNQVGGDIQKDFIGCLPEMPQPLSRFVQLSKQLGGSKRSYSNYLLTDPTLSTRIFSYTNLILNPQNLGYISTNKAISVMGMQRFKNIVLVFSLYPIFEDAGCVELFIHSLETAFIAQAMASAYKFINEYDAFLLAFLHDIGKIPLKIRFGEKFKLNPDKDDVRSRESLLDEETRELSYCHTELSEYVARSWNLPVVITDAIRFHHFPLDAMLPQAASIIYLSNIVQKQDFKQQEQFNKILGYIQLTKADVLQFAGSAQKNTMPYYEILNIKRR